MALPNIRVSGLLLMVAGILFGSFMFFHPINNPQGALEAIWVPVHSIWFIAYLLIIISFLPIYNAIASLGSLAILGYWLSFLGTVLSLPIATWDAFAIPYLAKHAPDFILEIEENSMETSILVYRAIVFLTIFLFSLGFMLYGAAIAKSSQLLKFAGICLALGAPIFWIGALFVSKGSMGNIVTEIGALLFGLGLTVLGQSLFVNSSQFITKDASRIQPIET
ncbi:hypothetical protein TUMEXPCC7403_18385 [Tumidithrix helvetica PCC 7403]